MKLQKSKKNQNTTTCFFWLVKSRKPACNSFFLDSFFTFCSGWADAYKVCSVFNEPVICRAFRIKAFGCWGEMACSWSNFIWQLHTTQAICTTLGTSLSCSLRYILIGMSKTSLCCYQFNFFIRNAPFKPNVVHSLSILQSMNFYHSTLILVVNKLNMNL